MKKIKINQFILTFTMLTLTLVACKDDNYTDWKILNERWIETHKSDPGFTQTESGLCYKVIHQGTTRRPNASSWVVVEYTGKLIDGTKFDSGTYNYYLSSAIVGWKEAIVKMNGGGKYILYVPYNLAYGVDGSGNDIPPYSTLVFEVELTDSYY